MIKYSCDRCGGEMTPDAYGKRFQTIMIKGDKFVVKLQSDRAPEPPKPEEQNVTTNRDGDDAPPAPPWRRHAMEFARTPEPEPPVLCTPCMVKIVKNGEEV